MAPKRGRKKVAHVVKTTKVVEETVEVSILGTQSQDDEVQVAEIAEKAQSPTKVMSERREEHSTVTTKTIPIEVEVEDEDEAQNEESQHQLITQETESETQEPEVPLDEPHFEKIGTPPREETKPRQEEPLDDEGRPTKRGKKQSEDKKSVPKREKIDKNKAGKKNRKKGRRMREFGEGREGYKSYVFKVLKQVHPGMRVSGKAMTVINNLMSDMFERLANEAGKLGMHAKKQTLTAREIQGAVKLVLPGELGKHAIAEGSKAVTNYMNYHNN